MVELVARNDGRLPREIQRVGLRQKASVSVEKIDAGNVAQCLVSVGCEAQLLGEHADVQILLLLHGPESKQSARAVEWITEAERAVVLLVELGPTRDRGRGACRQGPVGLQRALLTLQLAVSQQIRPGIE